MPMPGCGNFNKSLGFALGIGLLFVSWGFPVTLVAQRMDGIQLPG
jgi:hypothetical protein